MSKIVCPVTWVACRAVQSYIIPVTGSYVITAAGAQGGAGAGLGGRGARVEGLFYLREREIVNIVVGEQGSGGGNPVFASDLTACGGGGGGGSFVWKTSLSGAMPTWPLLVAAGGGGGGDEEGGDGETRDNSFGTLPAGGPAHRAAPGEVFGHFGGGGLGWFIDGPNGAGPIYCPGGTRWSGGEGVAYGSMQGGHGGYGGGGAGGFLGYACGGGGGFEGGAGGGQQEYQLNRVRRSGGGTSYNSGSNPVNAGGVQTGNGFVTIAAVPLGEVIQIRLPSGRGAARVASDLTRRQPGMLH